jgi:hypothetical protein
MTPSGTWQDLMAYNGFKPYECPVCPKTFNSPSALEHHLANTEKLTLLEYQKSKLPGFACYSPKCTDKPTAIHEHARRHVKRLHEGD